jgi:hypothetical protein
MTETTPALKVASRSDHLLMEMMWSGTDAGGLSVWDFEFGSL